MTAEQGGPCLGAGRAHAGRRSHPTRAQAGLPAPDRGGRPGRSAPSRPEGPRALPRTLPAGTSLDEAREILRRNKHRGRRPSAVMESRRY